MSIENPYETSNVLAIAMFALSVIACKIIKYELPQVLDLNIEGQGR